MEFSRWFWVGTSPRIWGEVVGIVLGAPVLFGLLGGFTGWVRGGVRDQILASHDLENQKQSEAIALDHRLWSGMAERLKQNQASSNPESGNPQSQPSSPARDYDDKGLCYLCGERLQPSGIGRAGLSTLPGLAVPEPVANAHSR